MRVWKIAGQKNILEEWCSLADVHCRSHKAITSLSKDVHVSSRDKPTVRSAKRLCLIWHVFNEIDLYDKRLKIAN